MSDINEMESSKLSNSDKVISLYKFIRELSGLKQKVVLNVNEYPWFLSIGDIHDDSNNISITYRDKVDEELENSGTVLLSVHKPEYEACPTPAPIFENWIENDWSSFRNDVEISQINNKEDGSSEKFYDNEKRVELFEKWLEIRKIWVEKQQFIEKTRKLFIKLYQLHIDLERDSETLEMVVSAGFLRDRNNFDIKHPTLTRRVKTKFNADSNTIFIEDTDVETELYTILFQNMDDINLDSIPNLREDLKKNDYHPMDRNDTPDFLKLLTHNISSESIFSIDGEPQNWSKSNRILMYFNPTFIVRKRVDGTLKAVEQIIENIEQTGYYPTHIGEIVSGEQIDVSISEHQETLEEQLAAVGGESIDIFLSKEANKEQLEIAKRIEHYNAILVQGPPGTGKTHTIANLLGHFLAQGKNVLVTSHTKKALAVLKEKVSTALQNLCVSILDDSNEDMERSIDGITDYMSKYTSYELKRQMDELAIARQQIIDNLAETRRKLYTIIHQECNSIVINGDEVSPAKAASFVVENADRLSYIPGAVRLHSPIPASFEELSLLYRSNEGIDDKDEAEFLCNPPQLNAIFTPNDCSSIFDAVNKAWKNIEEISLRNEWQISLSLNNQTVTFDTDIGNFTISEFLENELNELNSYALSFEKPEKWMEYAAIDGKKGVSYSQKWITLINRINATCDFAESIVSEQFAKNIVILGDINKSEHINLLGKIKEHLASKEKISKIDLFFNRSWSEVLDSYTINGEKIRTSNDCNIILNHYKLENLRLECSTYWDTLLATHGVSHFLDLNKSEPEQIARKWIPIIKKYLNWYGNEYEALIEKLKAAQLPVEIIVRKNALISEFQEIDHLLASVYHIIPDVVSSILSSLYILVNENKINECANVLKKEKRVASAICSNLACALHQKDISAYGEWYKSLEVLNSKIDLQEKRNEILKKISPIAPEWAEAVRQRTGIHGQYTVPSTIEEAWKWKQYHGIIADIISEPFEELQEKSVLLSKEYRKITSLYAEKCAWHHLLLRTEKDINMKQALQGWKLTVKRIGRGTGRNVARYRAEARKLMAKCQASVPAWIMPTNKALESLSPKDNQFDVIIIDEASQSDLTGLAIAYMAKKLIVVGDDKQVSPMAVGVEIDKMNRLVDMYIKNIIPNAHLYNAKTSLYEIALTTFQHLMLIEHFRCVPEIIGYSNKLSYDYKIKPLRDASSNLLLPAVVNYRVANGQRIDKNKTNPNEAYSIIALIKACMEQPEYAKKSFGIISMLGDDQVKKIQSLLFQYIDSTDIEKRRILCGNASHFQGDERDVIFLSLVDSSSSKGPLSLMTFGSDDSTRKRYNVAASRAKDQLWVVDSLDCTTDLQPDDIRKGLIEYSMNPKAFNNLINKIEEKSESPFESSVAKALVAHGYHIEQQRQVGAYRLDMVVICGNKIVAIECDGERWHSGESKTREDMERQTILERLGWHFIRIRGSEFYRNEEETMNRVYKMLEGTEIFPESKTEHIDKVQDSDLLSRVKARALEILTEIMKNKKSIDLETIESALNTNMNKEFVENVSNEVKAHPFSVMSEHKRSDEFIKESNNNKVFHNSLTKTKQRGMPEKSLINNNDIISKTQISSAQSAQLVKKLLSELTSMSAEFVDNYLSSNTIWVIYSLEKKDIIENTLQDSKLKYVLYKRGSNATRNRPAWRIIC